MRRKELSPKLRRITIGVLAVLMAVSVGGLGWSFLRPTVADEEYTAFAYNQEADIDYQVHMRPNEVLPGTVQEAGRAYITELTDYINTTFGYRFSGEETAEINAEYAVTAALTAYTGSGGESKPVWDRSFVLQPPKPFSGRDRELAIRETVNIPLADYVAYAARVAEGTRFQPSELDLKVQYKVTVEAETEAGTVREELSPTLVIPMGGRTFTVGGDLSLQDEGGLTATRVTAVPWAEEIRIGFAVAGGVWGVMLAALLLCTRSAPIKTDPLQMELRQFLKDQNDRIVTSTVVPSALGKTVTVKSLDDLTRAADELEKPIVYHQGDGREYSFYVLAGEYVYRYTMRLETLPFTRSKLAARVYGEEIKPGE